MAYSAVPIGIGIAILKYRLYDIDIVIRKALVFASLAAFFTVVYVLVVGGVGAVMGSLSTPTLSFAAAALVAIGFQPALARARRFADRVVYGKRSTPYEVLAELGERLGETYAADDVLPRIARVLGEGVGADRADVLLLVEDDFRAVASWPEAATATGEADLTVEVRHQGQLLGALAVSMPANDPMDPAKERLVTDLAAQAGLVLRNVRLTEELRARIDDLQAAQKRLVAAQDDERRRLERNIHDGAQQQLVALTVKLRLADTLIERDPSRARELLDQLRSDTNDALEDLRDLARGIYPPLLADKGLLSGARGAGAEGLVARSRCTPTGSTDTPRRSRPPRTSPASRRSRTWRSTPRRPGRSSRSRTGTGGCGSRSPTTAWDSTPPTSGTAPGSRGSPTGWERWPAR